ncbi:MAG: hypothetical protein WC665_01160 [Sulfurimonas sp.]|jgi:hypothetical protein
MKIIGNAYVVIGFILAVFVAILINVYISTQKYNKNKAQEENVIAAAFIGGKTLNCVNGGREEDISIIKGWEYRDSDGNVRFKKDSSIFLPSQCREIVTK